MRVPHLSHLLGVSLLVSVACDDTWEAFGQANQLKIETKHPSPSGLIVLKGDKPNMHRSLFNGYYGWVHFPSPNTTTAGSGDDSDNSSVSGQPTCDLSQLNKVPAVSHSYDLPSTEDHSAQRILVFGNTVMNTAPPQDLDPNRLTSTAFPGRILRNEMVLPSDEGLYVCCTNQHRKPSGTAFIVEMKQPPKTARPEIRNLASPPGYTVLSSDGCATHESVIHQKDCTRGDCRCKVECSLSCQHNPDDFFYTWTFTDRVLNLTKQRVVAVGSGFWNTHNNEDAFRPNGATLHVTMRSKALHSPEPREYFDGWMKFRLGQITIQCNIMKVGTEWESSASLDINRLQKLRHAVPQLNASSCILEAPTDVSTTTAPLATQGSSMRGGDVTPKLIATPWNASSLQLNTTVMTRPRRDSIDTASPFNRSTISMLRVSDRPSQATAPVSGVAIVTASGTAVHAIVKATEVTSPQTEHVMSSTAPPTAAPSAVSGATAPRIATPTDGNMGAVVAGVTVGVIVALAMAAMFVYLYIKWKRAMLQKERTAKGRTTNDGKGGKLDGRLSLGANASNSSQVDIMGEQGYAYVSQSSHGSDNSSLASPTQQSAANSRSLDLRYSRPPQGKHVHLGLGGWPSDAVPQETPASYGAFFAHPFSTAAAHATLQSWNANSTQLTPFRFLSSSDLEHWSIARERISLGSRIGKGAFGQVYLGTYQGSPTCSQDIALKMPKDGMFDSPECLQDMISEANIMFRVCQGRSPHLVNLVGVCVDERGPPIIVLEHCSKGSLISWLRAWRKAYGSATATPRVLPDLTAAATKAQPSKQSPTAEGHDDDDGDIEEAPYINRVLRDANKQNALRSDPKRHRADSPSAELKDAGYANTSQEPRTKSLASLMIAFAHQISSGMEALVRYNVVHRDLAARNILLTQDSTLKIADFGLAREISSRNGYYRMQSHVTLPYLWMAPETLPVGENDNIVFTEMTDVWSFGVVLWEIATLGKVPYGRGTPLLHLYNLLRSGERLQDPGCCDEVRKMMSACWHADPKERPAFSQLRHYFASKLEKRADCQYLRLLDDTSIGTVDIIPELSNEESDFV